MASLAQIHGARHMACAAYAEFGQRDIKPERSTTLYAFALGIWRPRPWLGVPLSCLESTLFLSARLYCFCFRGPDSSQDFSKLGHQFDNFALYLGLTRRVGGLCYTYCHLLDP